MKSITITTDSEDLKRLNEIATREGMTSEELISAFISDLTCGHNTHGSDERDCADDWLSRCAFFRWTPNTWLKWLARYGGLEEVADCIDYQESLRDDIEYEKEQDTPDNEYIADNEAEIEFIEEEIQEYWKEYQQSTAPDEQEIEPAKKNIMQWYYQQKKFEHQEEE